MDRWQESVEAVLALEPEHLSLYGLTLEEGTPLWQRRDQLTLADGDLQADMYLWAVERLSQAGYDQYEISNFAREGKRSRHNLKYWMGREYVGFGPGAHSDFGGRRYSYVRNLERYIDGMLSGGKIVDASELIPAEERGYEYLMLRLRTVMGIDGVEYNRTFRMNFAPLEALLRQYQDRGWAVQEESGRWALYAQRLPAVQPAHRGTAGGPGGEQTGDCAAMVSAGDVGEIKPLESALFPWSGVPTGDWAGLLCFRRFPAGYWLVGALLALQKSKFRVIGGSPVADTVEQGNGGEALLREGVLHAGRDLVKGLPFDDLVSDEFL